MQNLNLEQRFPTDTPTESMGHFNHSEVIIQPLFIVVSPQTEQANAMSAALTCTLYTGHVEEDENSSTAVYCLYSLQRNPFFKITDQLISPVPAANQVFALWRYWI